MDVGDDNALHVALVVRQPIAIRDVVAELRRIARAMPINGVIEIASREIRRLASFAQDILGASEDPRDIVVSADTPYFGARMQSETLAIGATLPGRAIHFDD